MYYRRSATAAGKGQYSVSLVLLPDRGGKGLALLRDRGRKLAKLPEDRSQNQTVLCRSPQCPKCDIFASWGGPSNQ